MAFRLSGAFGDVVGEELGPRIFGPVFGSEWGRIDEWRRTAPGKTEREPGLDTYRLVPVLVKFVLCWVFIAVVLLTLD
jgi:hypothetical protein